MHELSIAMSLIELAGEELERMGNPRLAAVHVRVGPLSGVVADALTFAFEMAREDTPAQDAELRIETVPVIVYCDRCAAKHSLPERSGLLCPVCHQPTPEIVQGRELELSALEVEEEHADAHHRSP